MSIEDIQSNWDEFGRTDPYWAVLTEPGKQGNKWDPAEFYASGKLRISKIMERLAVGDYSFPNGVALDFGSGAGRLSQALTAYFDRVVGVDIAPSMVDLARRNNPFGDRLEFVLNGEPNLKVFQDQEFDFILSLITLQHTTPELIESYLTEFGRVLRNGGLLVFELPDKQNPKVPAKIRLRNALPAPLVRAYHIVRHGRPLPFYKPGGEGPQMNLCGIAPERVKRVLTEAGLSVCMVDAPTSKDPLASYLYIVTKR